MDLWRMGRGMLQADPLKLAIIKANLKIAKIVHSIVNKSLKFQYSYVQFFSTGGSF